MTPIEATSSEVDSPTRDELISALDHEIQSLKENDTRAGWTPWALAATIGAGAWAILDEVEKHPPRLEVQATCVLAFSLLFDAARFLASALEPYRLRALAGRFRASNTFLSRRLGGAVELTRALLLIGLGYVIAPMLPSPVVIAALILPCSYVVLLGATMVVIWLEIPFTERSTPSAKLISGFLGAAGLASGLYLLTRCSPGLTASDLRISALTATVLLLVAVIAHQADGAPLLPELQRLRRLIALHQMDLVTARRQVDLALHGAALSDILHPRLATIFATLSDTHAHLDAASHKVATLIAKSQGDTSFSDKELEELDPIVSGIEADIGRAQAAHATFKAQQNTFHFRLQYLMRLDPEAHDDGVRVLESLKTEIAKIRPALDKLKNDTGIAKQNIRVRRAAHMNEAHSGAD